MATKAPEAPGLPPLDSAAATQPRIYFGYWIVSAAFVAQLVSVGSQNYVIGAFFKPMTDDLDWSRSEFTIARTLGQVIMAFIGLFIGAHIDQHGGRRVMLVGTTILGIALFSTSYVQELWQWIILNGVVLTTGSAMIGNLVVNVTLSKWFVEKRGRVVGFAAMGVSFAGVALTPLTTILIDEYGWRAAWRVLAVGAVALAYPITFLMRRAPEDHGLFPDGKTAAQVAAGAGGRAAADWANSLTRGEALRTPQFYLLVLAFGLFVMSIPLMLLQTIPFMTDEGYSRNTAALMITVTSVPALISKPIWGIFIDQMQPKWLTAASAVLTGGSLMLIVPAANAQADWLVYTGFFFLGWGWGGMIPLQEVTWASYFGRRYIGAVRSAGLPFSLFLGAGAPLIASVYYDIVGNYNGAILSVAACCFISAILVLFINRPAPKNPPA